MSLVRLVIICLLYDAFTLARKVKRKESYHLNVPPPPPPSPPAAPPYLFEDINHDEFPQVHPSHISRFTQVQHPTGTGAGSGVPYLTDNGLRNIAKGSADQANSAVANQNAAGKQAAYVAKSTLAQAASQAASTAIAAVKGKELLLRRLEEHNIETHREMERELTQLQQAKRSAKAAQYAAQQAINHVSVLTAALNNAQASSELAQKSASEAATELASQIDMVAQAKGKLEQIEARLYEARLDYEETKEAAEKAALSAQEAHINANDAAAHANIELNDSVHFVDHTNEANLKKRSVQGAHKFHSGRQ